MAKKDTSSAIRKGMAVGIAVGAAIGVAFDNLAIGVAIGIAMGAAMGAAWPERPDDTDADDEGTPPPEDGDGSD